MRPFALLTPRSVCCTTAPLAAEWRATHLPLLERGWVVGLAHVRTRHAYLVVSMAAAWSVLSESARSAQLQGFLRLVQVRGGGELGPEWHDAGTKWHKQTSANDLVDTLKWLHGTRRLSSPLRSSAEADSAGGLALGGLLNDVRLPLRMHLLAFRYDDMLVFCYAQDPGLLAAAVLRAPFLDPCASLRTPLFIALISHTALKGSMVTLSRSFALRSAQTYCDARPELASNTRRARRMGRSGLV